MKAVLFVIACLIVAAMAGSLGEESYQYLFTKFAQQYNKQYQTNDVFNRYQIFKKNLDLIIAHNTLGESFKMGINEFADFTAEEFNAMMGLKPAKPVTQQYVAPCQMPKVENIDWVAKGVVNPVKNQGSCGSCWAFSSTSVVESAWAIKTGKLLDLSEQNLVDCVNSKFDPSFISEGCGGGLMSESMKFLAKVGGQCLSANYPYTARDGTCNTSCGERPAPVKSHDDIKPATGDANHIAALQKGPVSVGLAASSSAFQFYKSGIVKTCSDRSLNHAVVLTGIGTENGEQYYNIRNSWGASWGDAGYIKLSINGNQCGLHTSPWDVLPYV